MIWEGLREKSLFKGKGMRNDFEDMSCSFLYFYNILETSLMVVLDLIGPSCGYTYGQIVENSWNLCNVINLNYFQGH